MSIMQLVKKKKGKKRPGYRGPGGYQGGATNQGGAGNPGDGTPAGGQGDGNYTGPESFTTPEQDLNQKNVVREGRINAIEELIDRPTFALDGSGKYGLGSLITGALGLVNPVAGLIGRGISAIPNTFNTFRQSDTLADFFNTMRGNNLPVGVVDEEDKEEIINPNIDLPFVPTTETPETFDYSNNMSVGRFSPFVNINPNNITGASRNMIDANQMSDYFNNQQYMDGGIVDLVDIYD